LRPVAPATSATLQMTSLSVKNPDWAVFRPDFQPIPGVYRGQNLSQSCVYREDLL
jgi:hypothetical protein